MKGKTRRRSCLRRSSCERCVPISSIFSPFLPQTNISSHYLVYQYITLSAKLQERRIENRPYFCRYGKQMAYRPHLPRNEKLRRTRSFCLGIGSGIIRFCLLCQPYLRCGGVVRRGNPCRRRSRIRRSPRTCPCSSCGVLRWKRRQRRLPRG